MPSLDHNAIATTTGTIVGPCRICQVSVYRNYCRQCDEYFHVCKCRPHGHEGHRVYPMVHLPFHPVSLAWDAIDQALRGERTNTTKGPVVRCSVCNEPTPDMHFSYLHAEGCPMKPLADAHAALTAWIPPQGTEVVRPASRFLPAPQEPPQPQLATLHLPVQISVSLGPVTVSVSGQHDQGNIVRCPHCLTDHHRDTLWVNTQTNQRTHCPSCRQQII